MCGSEASQYFGRKRLWTLDSGLCGVTKSPWSHSHVSLLLVFVSVETLSNDEASGEATAEDTNISVHVTTMMSHMYSFGVPAQLYKEDRLKLQQARYEARFTPPRILNPRRSKE